MKKTAFPIVIILFCTPLFSQQFAKKTIQIGINNNDGANSVFPIEGGKFLLSGSSLTVSPAFNVRSLLMITDSLGNAQCERLVQTSPDGSNDVMYDYKKIFNTFYAIGSYYDTLAMDYNTYLIKTDDSCNAEIFRFDFGVFEKMIRVYPSDSDSSILILGYQYTTASQDSSQIVLAKVDTNGNLLWKREYGGPGYDFAYHLLELPDKGYMLSGEKTTLPYPNNTDKDLFLMKLDSSFNEVWTKSYGTSDDDIAGFASNSVLTSDSAIIMVGTKDVPNPYYAFYLAYYLKTDLNGTIEWEKYDSTTDYFAEIFMNIQPSPDGNFYISGYKSDADTAGLDVWLVKIDDSGSKIWERYYDFDNTEDALYARDMSLNQHGGVAITGFVIYEGPDANDIVFITTDSCGYTEGDVSIAQIQLDTVIDKTVTLHNTSPSYCSWQWHFGDGDSSGLRNPTHTYNDTGSYTITLITRAGNDWDTAYLQIHVGDTLTGIGHQASVVRAEMKLYPNPASSFIVLSGYIPDYLTGAKVEFYDLQGRLVKTETLKNGLINQGVSTKGFAAGVYAYRVCSDASNIAVGRIYIEP